MARGAEEDVKSIHHITDTIISSDPGVRLHKQGVLSRVELGYSATLLTVFSAWHGITYAPKTSKAALNI